MISMTLGEIAEIVDGKLLNIAETKVSASFPVIDSHKAHPGTFFVAFSGQKVDGHDFVSEAINSGCDYALVSKDVDFPAIKVLDVAVALSKLAAAVRERLTSVTVIGITGSHGKTTAKDLLRHILEIHGETIAPEESLNNELGVPLLVLRCQETTKYCIVEMGARHKGDITYLAGIAKPNIGLVLNVGTAHLGEFGSRQEIANTKSELIRALPADGIAVLGSYDEFTPKMAELLGIKTVIFGEKPGLDVRAADIEVREGRAHFDLVTRDGRSSVSLQLLGLHQVSNALAAAAVCTAIGIPIDSIAAALSTAEAKSKWRMEILEDRGLILINDSYNANPESMAAALRTLALLTQERGGVSWAFLGKMHELGESSLSQHEEIGRLVSEIGIDHLVSIGNDGYLTGFGAELKDEGDLQLHHFDNQESALSLVKHFQPGDVVLVKASRAEELDILAAKIFELWKGGE